MAKLLDPKYGPTASTSLRKAHLTEAKSKIDRTLDKPLVDAGGRSQIIILGAGQKAAEQQQLQQQQP